MSLPSPLWPREGGPVDDMSTLLDSAAALITALGGFATAMVGVAGAIYALRRVSKRERPAAARKSHEKTTAQLRAALAEAAADGELTAEEIADVIETQFGTQVRDGEETP
jgi:hypothetical protein